MAETAGLGVSIDGLYTRLGEAAITHLAAIVRQPYPLAGDCHYWFKEDPMKGGVVLEQGKAKLPQSPGLGVEFVDDLVEAIRVKR
jgi:L-alanine-DL-glutamate epimerase-like enolase superfamily enzyme